MRIKYAVTSTRDWSSMSYHAAHWYRPSSQPPQDYGPEKLGFSWGCSALPEDVWEMKMPAPLKGHQNYSNLPYTTREMSEANSTKILGLLLIHEFSWMQSSLALPTAFHPQVLALVSFTFSCHTVLPETVHSADSPSSTWRAKYITLITNLKKRTGSCCWFVMNLLI